MINSIDTVKASDKIQQALIENKTNKNKAK